MAPLLTLDRCELENLPLDEALPRGHLHITELSESGSVAALWLINRAWQAVMLFDVADVDGAKIVSDALDAIESRHGASKHAVINASAFLLEIAAAHALFLFCIGYETGVHG